MDNCNIFSTRISKYKKFINLEEIGLQEVVFHFLALPNLKSNPFLLSRDKVLLYCIDMNTRFFSEARRRRIGVFEMK